MNGYRRPSWLRVVVAALCVAALVWTIAALGPVRVIEAAAGVDPGWIALALVAIAARFAIWAVKWMLILRQRERVSYRLCLGLVLAGAFVNLATPTAKLGGGIVRSLLLSRLRGWPKLESFGWSLADQATNLLGQWALFGVVAVAAAPSAGDPLVATLLTGGGVGSLLVVALAGLARDRLLAAGRLAGLGRLAGRLIPTRFRGERVVAGGDGLAALVRPIRAGRLATWYGRDVVLGGLGFASLCVSNLLVYRALGAEVPWLLGSAAVL
ncbi:MAG TPA: flippase-like domain-containing protein, partial [Candidatus Polarisedimenticolaceae bacterium]|nr:flippase-like domain-containing protein [Candidatus Polarisedimenticolaceae bacterium]